MKRPLKTKIVTLLCLIIVALSGCSKDDPGPSGSGSGLTYMIDGKSVQMYSVADDIWDNQDDNSMQIKLHYVVDPTFKNKTTNNSIMLGIRRLSTTGTYELGGDGDNNIVYIENGMENNSFSYDAYWESTGGKIEVTELTSRGLKGTFSGTLIKKTYQGLSVVEIPGSEIQIEKGSFVCNF